MCLIWEKQGCAQTSLMENTCSAVLGTWQVLIVSNFQLTLHRGRCSGETQDFGTLLSPPNETEKLSYFKGPRSSPCGHLPIWSEARGGKPCNPAQTLLATSEGLLVLCRRGGVYVPICKDACGEGTVQHLIHFFLEVRTEEVESEGAPGRGWQALGFYLGRARIPSFRS